MYHERGEMPRPEYQPNLNESSITATSKRPGTSATAGRKSPHDRQAVVKEANRKKVEVDNN